MTGKGKKIFSLLILAVLGGVFLYAFSLEKERVLSSRITAWENDHSADCGLVLTGAAGRIREGFDLLSHRQIKKLIISGVHPQAGLRDIFPQWPYYGNLDVTDVILERRSGTTYGNAQQSLGLVEALHCRDVVLITSHLHMYRAVRTFKGVFPARIPLYPRAVLSGPYEPEFFDVFMETIKSLFYSFWAYQTNL